MPNKTIYLDHAAATPLRVEAFESMLPYLKETYGNPSSIHHKGRAAFDALTNARAQVAGVLGVTPTEITFTGSGTEANNLAILGAARALRARGKHILISAIEHSSVLESGRRLSEDGFEVECISVDKTGMVNIENVIARIRPDTTLISIMYANNEIGTIEPITALSKRITETFSESSRPLLHTDACQASGQLPLSPRTLGVDLMTINSSKVYGPKGVGALYVRAGVTLTPHILGGEQERALRGGTENIAGIVGFATALALGEAERETYVARITQLRDSFIKAVCDTFPNVVVNGHLTERLPNNAHFSFPNIEGESLLLLLDLQGVCASTGSACNARDLAPSHVLRAIDQSHELIHGSVRFSLGRDTTETDIKETVDALKIAVARLESLSPLPLTIST